MRFKRAIKYIKVSKIFHFCVAIIAVFYIRLVMFSSRKTHCIPDESISYLHGTKPAIFALWHSQILLIPAIKGRKLPLQAIVSNHNDGRLIGKVLGMFGVNVVYGSTSSGGANALRVLVQLSKNCNHIAITPDGPRGPNQIAGTGIAQLAMLTGVPIICISCAASRKINLNSWDKFAIAIPFSRLHFAYSKPISFADIDSADEKHATKSDNNKRIREEFRMKIQQELNSLTKDAEQKVS